MKAAGPDGWHPALAHALLGHVPAGLGNPAEPDLDVLLAELDALVPDELARLRGVDPDSGWPHPVPPALRPGLGYAQLSALIEQLRHRLVDRAATRRVTATRPLTSEERRWAADVPPHHGD